MICRWGSRVFVVGVFLWVVTGVYGQDLAALKASFEAEIEALDTKKLDGALAQAHDDIVLFGVFSPFPIVGKEAFRQAVQEYFDDHEQATFSPIDPEFSIIENTGVAWGNYRISVTPKGGSPTRSHGRYIWTYTNTDGKWQILSMHISPLPD